MILDKKFSGEWKNNDNYLHKHMPKVGVVSSVCKETVSENMGGWWSSRKINQPSSLPRLTEFP